MQVTTLDQHGTVFDLSPDAVESLGDNFDLPLYSIQTKLPYGLERLAIY
jgi:hypothetical protein